MTTSTAETDLETRLAALSDEFWEGSLADDPIAATLIGDRRYDDRLPDPSPEARAARAAALSDLLGRVGAIDPAALPPEHAITRRELAGEIERDLAALASGLDEWTVDALDGPQVMFQNLASLQTVSTPEQGAALSARWRAIGPYLDTRIANLRRGLAAGRVAARPPVERVLGQLDALLAKADRDWPLMTPAAPHADWSPAENDTFAGALAESVSASARPAFEALREVLRSEVLPRARDEEHAGLAALPGGDATYARLIEVHTSLPISADEVHRIGLEEVASVRAAMTSLGETLLGVSGFADVRDRLRSDPELRFSTREEVENTARSTMERAEAAVPAVFGRLPKARCRVERIAEHEERDSVLGYYREPAIDGSRPGTYYVNTYLPRARPRYEAEVLAFHESVPGHHTQIALAQEVPGLPKFRRYGGVTAYIEGWGLYSERVCDELGLYSGDLARLGMLGFEAWRSCRLVVDTGLHALGWSRSRAIDYMIDNTLLARENIVNEVDRYIVWPGQALAYKMGQREFLRGRAAAESAMGPRFRLADFHDTVLAQGAVSLPTLRTVISEWSGA